MSHYYDQQQNSPAHEEHFEVTLRGHRFECIGVSGTFSKKKVDTATQLLIQHCDLDNASRVLDLGCGWGPVAIVLKKAHPSLHIVASDVSKRAVAYTQKNAIANGVDIEIVRSSLFEAFPDARFDTILTNPPYVAGRKMCYAFIDESYKHLVEGGNLQLVARHQKGGKMLAAHMKERFGNVRVLAKQSGFRIYQSVKYG